MLLRHAWLPITAQPRETLKPETYCFVVYHTSQPVHKVKNVVGAGFEPSALALKGLRVKPPSLTDHIPVFRRPGNRIEVRVLYFINQPRTIG